MNAEKIIRETVKCEILVKYLKAKITERKERALTFLDLDDLNEFLTILDFNDEEESENDYVRNIEESE